MNAVAINQQEEHSTSTTEQHSSNNKSLACMGLIGRAFESIASWFASPDLGLEEWERIEAHPRAASRISEPRRWL